MANTGFDPLRADPFATTTIGSIVPYGVDSNFNGVKEAQPSPEEDALLLFANSTNTNTSSNTVDLTTPPRQRNHVDDVRKTRKQRVMKSPTGVATVSNLNSRSIMNDSNFAPPPELPPQQDYSSSLFHANSWELPSSLPAYEKINHSGSCFSRISVRTKLLKVWKPVFWIIYDNSQLLIFKSKTIFNEWLMNPHLSKNARDALVKLRVNFAALPTNWGYQVSTIRSKHYRIGTIYQFKLDKWHFVDGPSILAALGSYNNQDVDELYMILKDLVRKSPANIDKLRAGNTYDVTLERDSMYSSGDSVRSAPTFARPHDYQKNASGANSVRSAGHH